MKYFLKNLYNPENYHGKYKKDNFFEGWYYKIVDKDEENILAIIPGVFISKNEADRQSFIQILNGKTTDSSFIKYGFEEFKYNNRVFSIEIGNSSFSLDELSLDIEQGQTKIFGEIFLEGTKPWPVELFSPGIMGWYSFVPFMECNHGVLSLVHSLKGQLKINGDVIDFSGGKGYIEKDWGKSFPSSYVWTQTNHFTNKNVSYTGSVANIPWLFSFFRGFIIGLLIESRLYKFATYTGAKLNYLFVNNEFIKYQAEDKNYKITINANRTTGGSLNAPYQNNMLERISESMDSEIHVELFSKTENKIIFNDTGKHGGLEVHGNLEEIVDK